MELAQPSAPQEAPSNPGTEIDPDNSIKQPQAPIPPVKQEKKDLTSPKFAALARKESQLVRERAAIKAERDAIAKERDEAKKLVEAQRLATTNPLKALELLGLNYKQLTEYVLNDEKPTPELQAKSLRDELKGELQRELEERDKKLESQRKESEEKEKSRVVEQFKEQTKDFLIAKKDKYPLINHPKNDVSYAVETISAIIEQHFHNTAEKDSDGVIIKAGKLMSVSDAAQMYEDHLKELATEFYKTLEPKSEGQDKAVAQNKDTSKVQEPRTITNQMQSGLATNLPAKTETDRWNRALAALSRT